MLVYSDGYPEPTGTKTITENGVYDVKDYASADVQTPQPSGSISITQNGTVDVSQYASANVNVSGGGGGGDSVLIDLIERDITSIEIPSGVTQIGAYAFEGCTSLVSVTIPNTVTQIQNGAFYNDTAIKRINSDVDKVMVLPNSVTDIGDNAFYQIRMDKVVLPNTIMTIGKQALRNSYLREIWCYATTPPTLAVNNTNYWSLLNAIYVPSESVEAYKAAQQWSNKASIIQAIPE